MFHYDLARTGYTENTAPKNILNATYFTTGGFVQSSPAVAGGYVYVGSYDGQVYQLNASNISLKIANFSTGGIVSSSPAVAVGYVYVGCYYGQV
ncbi:MAG: PQQ-binding-like beta-propeller repeat protein, partial [Candidatus Omnitrophica bacterium]|nr:PQQ-binding-like beta-propeller repeat protein [Candidatus Omnitrophota bacterium]